MNRHNVVRRVDKKWAAEPRRPVYRIRPFPQTRSTKNKAMI